jgi:hypothetical protein
MLRGIRNALLIEGFMAIIFIGWFKIIVAIILAIINLF